MSIAADGDAARLRCFVIGPIGDQLAPIGSEGRVRYEQSLAVWEQVIEPACDAVGLDPVRADGLSRAGEITEQIFRRLRDDDVVIADVSGGNANVMYELGLRHTRPLLTVQIGEYGSLPFDITAIRTILFSRSPMGLINARDELIAVLTAGLAGEYDHVSATRVWNDPNDSVNLEDSSEADIDSDDDGPLGFLDTVAEGEVRADDFIAAIGALNQDIAALAELAQQATRENEESDARGGGMRGRLTVLARYAEGMNLIADRIEEHVAEYESALEAVSAANLAYIERMEADGEVREDLANFGMTIRWLAGTSRESMAALAGMVGSMRDNVRLSRLLRRPTDRITTLMDRMARVTEHADEWDRRLQVLGVPLPPEDWEPPETDDDSAVELADVSAGPSEPSPDSAEIVESHAIGDDGDVGAIDEDS